MIFDPPNRFLIRVGKLSDPFQNSTIKCTWNFKVWTLQILNVGFQVLNFSFCKSSLASKDANLKIKENRLFSWVTFPTSFRNLTCWHSNFKIEKIVNKCSFGFHLTFLNQNVIYFPCYRGCDIEMLSFWEMTFSRLGVLSMEPLCKTHCRKTYPNDCFVIAFLWRSFMSWILEVVCFSVFSIFMLEMVQILCWFLNWFVGRVFQECTFSTTNISIGHVRYFANSIFETKFECEFR